MIRVEKPQVLRLVLVASFSSLYLVFRVIPTFPMIAVPGAVFRAGDIVAPLYGVVLGPLLGPLAIALGTIVAFFAGAPPVFLGLDFLPASTCAAIVGLTVRGKRLLSVIFYAVLLVLFLALPFASAFIRVGEYSVPFNWLHIVGLAVLISPFAGRAVGEVSRDSADLTSASASSLGRHFRALLVLAFIGTLAQHVMGGIITQAVIGLNFNRVPGRPGQFGGWEAFWTFVFWLYPGERTLISLAAAALSAPVIVVLKRSRLTSYLPGMQASSLKIK